MEKFAESVLLVLGLYAAAGVLCLPWFHLGGLRRLDAGVQGWRIGFRAAITPGLVALWPLMVARCLRGAPGDPERPVPPRVLRRLHGIAIRLLAVAIPIVAVAALAGREEEPITPGAEAGPLPIVRWTRDGLLGDAPVATTLRADEAGRLQVELRVDAPLPIAAPLLYWYPETPTEGNVPQLLGAIPGPGTWRYALPPGIDGETGGRLEVLSFPDRTTLRAATRKGG